MNTPPNQPSWSTPQLEELVDAVLGAALHATSLRSIANFAVGLLGAESMTSPQPVTNSGTHI